MNRAILFCVAGLLASIGLFAQGIEYFVERPTDSMYTTLHARANGRTYTLVDKSKKMCLAVTDQRDWAGNGLKDALAEVLASIP